MRGSFCVSTPQQNGVAKRKNDHLLAITRASLFHKNVPKQYWGEAVLIAAHLINKLPTRVLNFKSPIETPVKFFPNLNVSNNLTPQIFGSVAFIHVHSLNMESLIHVLLDMSLLAIIPHKRAQMFPFTNKKILCFC